MLPVIKSADELAELVDEIGILPAFRNNIPGFSVEECIAPEYWFPDKGEGFWEWKGPVIQKCGCAYGKLFSGRAGFMRLDLYREFANYRRDGYDFDARYDDGLARNKDKQAFDLFYEHPSMLSTEMSRQLPGDGRKGLSEVMTRLQMQCYVVISNFEYQISKRGVPYGWGVTRYETPEYRFGAEFTDKIYAHSPEESYAIVSEHLKKILPNAEEKAIIKLIG